ncbi:MAG: hypothetical protein HKN15_13745 [Xanthomonadales bacterium]|nr:hypothetical protein [Xanthomonadales bacterium]
MSHGSTRKGFRVWLMASTLALVALLALSPIVDQQAEGNYERLFKRALVTFALARTLNGVISAVQGTELALQPAGVGVTLTPGEILDPINDLVERFSWIMLGASVSLGIQHVLLDVSGWWLLQGLVAICAVWLIILGLASGTAGRGLPPWLVRVFLISLFLRFAVPVTLILNEAVYDLFLETRYVQSTEVVNAAGEDIGDLGRREDRTPEGQARQGIFGSLGAAVDSTREALDFSEKVERIKLRATEIIEHVIQLSVVFVLQTGVIPLAFLWLFLQLARRALTVGPSRS